jgi:hypothetical protein
MSLALRRPQVASPTFAEWLEGTYYIDSDGICRNNAEEVIELPLGRPGWFKLEDTDARGFPTKVDSRNSLDCGSTGAQIQTTME